MQWFFCKHKHRYKALLREINRGIRGRSWKSIEKDDGSHSQERWVHLKIKSNNLGIAQ
jgi:hypothetical protein